MGIAYKLKPEVKEFILEQKKVNPVLSCRGLSDLVKLKFQVELSKSSINGIIKESGMSAPVGRRQVRKKRIAMPVLPRLEEKKPEKAEIRIEIEDKVEQERRKISDLEQERKRIAEEEARLKEEFEVKVRAEEELRRRAEGELEARAKAEAEARARAEEERLKAEEERKRRSEEEVKAKAEAEARAKLEEELRRQSELLKAQEEAQKRAAEAEALALRLEQEEKARLQELEKRAREAEEKLRAEEEAKAKAEQEVKAAEEAKKKIEIEIKIKKDVAQPKFSLPLQLENSGIILLRALDYYLEGGAHLAEILRRKSGVREGELAGRMEGLIYSSLLENSPDKSACEKAVPFPESPHDAQAVAAELCRAASLALQDVRCVKVALSDGSFLYLDGALHTAWSTPYVPYDFAAPFYAVKKQINRCFYEDAPCVLFTAPGYDAPSKEFFSFLACLDGNSGNINSFTLCGNNFEELEAASLSQSRKHNFIFGLWPWQFTEQRKVDSLGEFRPWVFSATGREFYIADIELQLFDPQDKRPLLLRGLALKGAKTDKIRLVVLSNFASGEGSTEDIAAAYLSRWPNLEEAFQDYSRKIELFTYTANSQRYFNAAELGLSGEIGLRPQEALARYLEALDLYFKWHILPRGYEDKGFAELNERFYGLKADITRESGIMLVKFILPADYPCLKELQYACCRLNEKQAIGPEGLRLWFKA